MTDMMTDIEHLLTLSGKMKSLDCFGSCVFADFAAIVKKGHSECGDSAFVFVDQKKIILAVFDGVSGESGAARAAETAARMVLSKLKPRDQADESVLRSVLADADQAIKSGYTTATILFLTKSGKYVLAAVGDSPAYLFPASGSQHTAVRPSVLISQSRAVGSGNSIMKFFAHRNIVTSVLGKHDGESEAAITTGTLKSGDMIMLASDGLSDNLYVKVNDGFVTDSSGCEDLARIIGSADYPKAMLNLLAKAANERMGKERTDNEFGILVPKQDDLAIAIVKFKEPD